MKKSVYILLIAVFVSIGIASLAQAPPAPPANAQSGGGGSPGPVGAPIDGGLGILLAMGAAYGSKKLYAAKKARNIESTPE
jgi:hypothetical protein